MGRIGKSTSRHVLGRFGSEKSTDSTYSSRPAPTAAATASCNASCLVFFCTFATVVPQGVSREFNVGDKHFQQRQTTMMQRRIPGRAAPFPTAQYILMCAVGRRQAQINRRHPGAMLAIARSGATVLEHLPHIRHLILVHQIREMAARGVAMMSADAQPSPGGKPRDELPEII